jgi:hypothetical protein
MPDLHSQLDRITGITPNIERERAFRTVSEIGTSSTTRLILWQPRMVAGRPGLSDLRCNCRWHV